MLLVADTEEIGGKEHSSGSTLSPAFKLYHIYRWGMGTDFALAGYRELGILGMISQIKDFVRICVF